MWLCLKPMRNGKKEDRNNLRESPWEADPKVQMENLAWVGEKDNFSF